MRQQRAASAIGVDQVVALHVGPLSVAEGHLALLELRTALVSHNSMLGSGVSVYNVVS